MQQIEYFRSHGYVFVSPQEILAAAQGSSQAAEEGRAADF